MNYLYGASVQGIQDFIFQTNELKDIVGASELVAEICTRLFRETLGSCYRDDHLYIGAAGNVRYRFDDRESCRRAVRDFPRRVITEAPGITISQAVVELDGLDETRAIDDLETKLKAQRNRPQPDLIIGPLGVRRSGRTGLPLVSAEGRETDLTTAAKTRHNRSIYLAQNSFYGREGKERVEAERFPFDVSRMTEGNDWLAIIHADGNGLGQVVQRVGHDLEQYRTFSRELDRATEQAANEAFRKIEGEMGGTYLLRPIVLGGDDMTAIINGRLAIDYATAFIRHFEDHTGEGVLGQILRQETGMDRLTACAGVAFIKSSYPFHYGYRLAEELCGVAKREAKRLRGEGESVPACLMYHKVEDSYVQSYSEIVDRALMPSPGISLMYGPYYLDPREGYMTIDELGAACESLTSTEGDGVRSGLRQWLSLLHRGEEVAAQHLERMRTVYGPKGRAIVNQLTRSTTRIVKSDDETKQVSAYPAYDVLSLYGILNLVTKKK